MMMKKNFLLVVAGVLMFIVLDILWFQVMGDFLRGEVGSIARLNINGGWDIRLGAALLVYVLMGIGTVVFVLPRAESVRTALLFGGLFGFVSYGLYDFTNLATLAAWTVPFVAVDMAWGTFVSGAVSVALFAISKRLRP
jgi:uncharacterized membrane protein